MKWWFEPISRVSDTVKHQTGSVDCSNSLYIPMDRFALGVRSDIDSDGKGMGRTDRRTKVISWRLVWRGKWDRFIPIGTTTGREHTGFIYFACVQSRL